jgi:hypothetical protein
MGFDSNSVRFLLYGRSLGADFEKTAMIGRQGLHLSRYDLQSNLAQFGDRIDDAALSALYEDDGGYAEGFLRRLGAQVVHSIDFSSYEKATHLHDLNQPIPDEHKGSYSVVVDAGSLEHVFNFPVAIRNCMEMVRVGGHFIGITPANNFFGHGFYQFSAETYYRVFSDAYGFETLTVMLWEEAGSRCYSVADPERLGRRVTLRNYRSCSLAIVACKRAECPVFAVPPHQSDYVRDWSRGPKPEWSKQAAPAGSQSLLFLLGQCVPGVLRRAAKRKLLSLLGVQTPEDYPESFQPFEFPGCGAQDGTSTSPPA